MEWTLQLEGWVPPVVTKDRRSKQYDHTVALLAID